MATQINPIQWPKSLSLNRAKSPPVFEQFLQHTNRDDPHLLLSKNPFGPFIAEDTRSSIIYSAKLRQNLEESRKAFLNLFNEPEETVLKTKPEHEVNTHEKDCTNKTGPEEQRKPPTKKISFKIKKTASIYKRIPNSAKFTASNVAQLTNKFNNMLIGESTSVAKLVSGYVEKEITSSTKVIRKPSVKIKPGKIDDKGTYIIKKISVKRKSSVRKPPSSWRKSEDGGNNRACVRAKISYLEAPQNVKRSEQMSAIYVPKSPPAGNVRAAIQIFETIADSDALKEAKPSKPAVPAKNFNHTQRLLLMRNAQLNARRRNEKTETDEVQIINIPLSPPRRCESNYESVKRIVSKAQIENALYLGSTTEIHDVFRGGNACRNINAVKSEDASIENYASVCENVSVSDKVTGSNTVSGSDNVRRKSDGLTKSNNLSRNIDAPKSDNVPKNSNSSESNVVSKTTNRSTSDDAYKTLDAYTSTNSSRNQNVLKTNVETKTDTLFNGDPASKNLMVPTRTAPIPVPIGALKSFNILTSDHAIKSLMVPTRSAPAPLLVSVNTNVDVDKSSNVNASEYKPNSSFLWRKTSLQNLMPNSSSLTSLEEQETSANKQYLDKQTTDNDWDELYDRVDATIGQTGPETDEESPKPINKRKLSLPKDNSLSSNDHSYESCEYEDDGYEYCISTLETDVSENLYETLPPITAEKPETKPAISVRPLPPRPPSRESYCTVKQDEDNSTYETIYVGPVHRHQLEDENNYETIYAKNWSVASNRDSIVSSEQQSNSLYGRSIRSWSEEVFSAYKATSDLSSSEKSDEWIDISDNEENKKSSSTGFVV